MYMRNILLALCVLAICATSALAKPGGGGKRQGPPPEAFTACEGKSAGDTASFTSPRGGEVTGICVEQSGKMVLRPDNPPERGKNKQ